MYSEVWRLSEAAAGRAVVLLLKHFESRDSTGEEMFGVDLEMKEGNSMNTEPCEYLLQSQHHGSQVSIQRITIIYYLHKSSKRNSASYKHTSVRKILKLSTNKMALSWPVHQPPSSTGESPHWKKNFLRRGRFRKDIVASSKLLQNALKAPASAQPCWESLSHVCLRQATSWPSWEA